VQVFALQDFSFVDYIVAITTILATLNGASAVNLLTILMNITDATTRTSVTLSTRLA